VESTRKDTRQAANKLILEAAVWNPHLTTTMMRGSVIAFLCRVSSATKTTTGEEALVWNKHSRLASVLLSSVAYEDNVEVELKEELVTQLVVVGHHDFVC
jgi:hypothetical protein